MKDNDAGCKRSDLFGTMGGKDDSFSGRVTAFQQPINFLGRLKIQAGCRFVQEDYQRVRQQGTPYALPFVLYPLTTPVLDYPERQKIKFLLKPLIPA